MIAANRTAIVRQLLLNTSNFLQLTATLCNHRTPVPIGKTRFHGDPEINSHVRGQGFESPHLHKFAESLVG